MDVRLTFCHTIENFSISKSALAIYPTGVYNALEDGYP